MVTRHSPHDPSETMFVVWLIILTLLIGKGCCNVSLW